MKVGIVGTGIIGASWGMALRKARTAEQRIEVWGYDTDPQRLEAVRAQLGAFDKTARSLPEVVKEAGVVILCTPVMALRDVMQEIAPHVSPGAIVTDVGSTKRLVMQWAAEILPRGVHFVGGHPMAGGVGLSQASADLFKGTSYLLVPPDDAETDTIETMANVARLVGGVVRFMDAVEHDSYVAAISHLPHMAASALMNLTTKSEGWRDLGALAANGFQQTTYGASGNPNVYADIARSNADQIIGWIERYQQELGELKEMIRAAAVPLTGADVASPKANDRLFEYLADAKDARDAWLAQRAKPVDDMNGDIAVPTKAEIRAEIRQSMFGVFARRPPRRDEPPRR